MTRFRGSVLAAGLTVALLAGAPSRAAEPRNPVPPARFEGVPLALVHFDIRGPDGAELSDPELRAAIAEEFALDRGAVFTVTAADLAVQQVRNLAGVAAARWELYESTFEAEPILVLLVEVDPSAPAPGSKGWWISGDARDFPTFVETDRALLRAQVNGGLGLFSDRNAWFGDPEAFVAGSPLFPDPAGAGWTSWGEASLEAGAHGAMQIGHRRLFAFGSITGVASSSAGGDPWRSDTRFEVELEKAYGGFVYASPASDLGWTISYGRQTWQLNKGFLFSQYAGSFNAADWGSSYIAARTALEQTALAKLRWRKLTFEAFLVDPQEYFLNDSGTEYRGVNLRYADGDRLELGGVYYQVPESKSTFILPDQSRVPREGMRTANLRLATGRLAGVEGLNLESEVARQTHESFAMDARAGYVLLGYEAGTRKWRPSLSYRFARFSGDDPATSTFERFDAPQSSGSENWLQGNVFKKTIANSNLKSHRLRLAASPSARVGVTLNYFYLWADQHNNRGGARPLQVLPTRSIGHEVDLTVSWAISDHFYFLALAGIAAPGSAIEKSLGGSASDWSTVQFSLFWNV